MTPQSNQPLDHTEQTENTCRVADF